MPSRLAQCVKDGWRSRRTALLALCLIFSPALWATEKPHAPDTLPGAVIVSAEAVVDLILSRPELVIIDSRKPSEYAKGHIEGAVNLLNTSLSRAEMEAACPNKATPIVFYCNGERCLRSSDSILKARDWGYRNLFWFRGGWKEWTDKRLPVITN